MCDGKKRNPKFTRNDNVKGELFMKQMKLVVRDPYTKVEPWAGHAATIDIRARWSKGQREQKMAGTEP